MLKRIYKNTFVSRKEALKALDEAFSVAREKLLIAFPRNNDRVLFTFNHFVERSRRYLYQSYNLPLRALLKRKFNSIWMENDFILFDSRRDVILHNSAATYIDLALRIFGARFDLLDADLENYRSEGEASLEEAWGKTLEQ